MGFWTPPQAGLSVFLKLLAITQDFTSLSKLVNHATRWIPSLADTETFPDTVPKYQICLAWWTNTSIFCFMDSAGFNFESCTSPPGPSTTGLLQWVETPAPVRGTFLRRFNQVDEICIKLASFIWIVGVHQSTTLNSGVAFTHREQLSFRP